MASKRTLDPNRSKKSIYSRSDHNIYRCFADGVQASILDLVVL
jgi:hypothetical protein